MTTNTQQVKAEHLRRLHDRSRLLVLPNAWDAASARVLELAGFAALATTSSGVAASLGYGDGQQMSRELMLEALGRITRAVECPVTADIEAGYGGSIAEVVQTVRAVIATGAVGFNIEDSLKDGAPALVDTAYQVELIQALRALADELAVPCVINARVDVFLLGIGEPESRLEHAISRANAYLQAGADCVYPIGILPREVIGELVRAINGPVNIMGGPPAPSLPELAQLGVARVSLAGGLLRASLGHLRTIAQELLTQGTYTSIEAEALSSADLRALF